MIQVICLLLSVVLDVVSAENEHVMEVNGILAAVIVCACVVVLVLVVTLCGGCTPMEVGSDDHAAAGGRKSNYSTTQYSSVATDVNTHVMTSGTTFADDPYQPNTNALPYNPHPQTAQAFTGYNAQTGQSQGQVYGQSGMIPAAGGYVPPRPGANRHISESEPPPPDYSEAIRSSQGQGHTGGSVPAQPYGW